MISGEVAEDEALILLEIRDAMGEFQEVECVVDTGFSGLMALSISTIVTLGLSPIGEEDVYLAHGTTTLKIYEVDVLWEGKSRLLTAFAVDGNSLVGMKMMRGSYIGVEDAEGGSVTIEPMN